MSRHSTTNSTVYTRGYRKATASQNSNHCVEVADSVTTSGQSHQVRDTQNRELGALSFGGDAWRALLAATRNA